jgi:coiled-coil domain-containing protein 40
MVESNTVTGDSHEESNNEGGRKHSVQEASADDESDDEYYENPVDLIKEFGTHPLMERAQKALTAQLKETQQRLQVQLQKKEEDLKRAAVERESLGVQLYGLQQQLARVQISLENAHNDYNSSVDARLQEEELLGNLISNNSEEASLIEEHKKQQKSYAAELESLRETIKQIEAYNDEVKSEIAVTRRATYKAEQSMQQLENNKENQDLYVDSLNKQVKQLQEHSDLTIEQVELQKKETKDAKAVLQDTVDELELIASEKKQLMSRWTSALGGLSRRDEALAQATQTIKVAESAVHDYDVQIEATRREIQIEQGKHEGLVSMRDRLENELQWVEENLTKIRVERDQLQERYTLLTKSLAQTDSEARKLDIVAKSLDADADALAQNLVLVTQERQNMEDEVQITLSARANVSKATENLMKEQSKFLKKAHDRENEGNEVENSIARMKVDRLNACSLNDQLQEQHGVVLKELEEKEAMIGKYQLEIRQRNDEVEKKMYRVDRLNKKFDKMVDTAGGEENLGPLENIISNLNKEADAVLTECKELERDWLRKQTDLVAVASEADVSKEANNELQARVTILSQQQLRLNKDLKTLRTEVKVGNHTNVDLQKDIAKLNALISVNHDQEGSLQNANFVMEMECVDELKQAERECVALQATINETKTLKLTILDEIVDTERQALLWEKKIQIDKETREALDPSVGQQETLNMEKEVHRMELRLEALKREQERLSTEMEKAVLKRAVIADRYVKAPPEAGAGGETRDLSQANAKRKIGNLKKEARSFAEEISMLTSTIDAKKAVFADMTVELECVTSQYAQSEEQSMQLQGEINDLLYQKQLNQERMSYKQKYAKRLKDLAQSKVEPSQTLMLERRLLASSQALDNVKEIIIGLQSVHPHLAEVLERVVAMADPNVNINSSAYSNGQE